MQIHNIEVVPVEAPVAIPCGSSRGLVPKCGAGIVQLTTNDGIESIGKA